MKNKVPRQVVILGLVSFFNDVASEMIYPILPIFLTSVLGAPVAVVGLIEGIAEATASLTKFFFGYVSDVLRRRKPFVVAGYSLGALSKLLIAFAFSWPLVLFARFIDRLGKGLRTAARDSLLLQNTQSHNKGYIFGFHRAFDSMGAVVGPLLALGLLSVLGHDIRQMFIWACVPAIIGVILLILLIKENGMVPGESKHFPKLSWRGLSPKLKLFLVISFIFSLGNSSDSFLLLRAKGMGFTTTMVVLAYVLYNISQTVFSAPAGSLADRIGARRVFAGGLVVFSLVYFLFGYVTNPAWIWVLFPVYGTYIAATDGVSKAYISQFVKKEDSGTFFGLHQTLTAVAGFLASFTAGILWTWIGPSAAMYYGSALGAVSFIAFFLYRKTV